LLEAEALEAEAEALRMEAETFEILAHPYHCVNLLYWPMKGFEPKY
jgi:hypothetical protein